MSKHKGMEPAFNYLEGTKCGKLTLLKSKGGYGECGTKIWFCVCECGTFRVVRDAYLKSGKTKSCGCMRICPTKNSTTAKQMPKTERALYNQKRKQILKERERIKKEIALNRERESIENAEESALFDFPAEFPTAAQIEAQTIQDKALPRNEIVKMLRANGKMTCREIHRWRGFENDDEISKTRNLMAGLEEKNQIKEGDRRRCAISNNIATTYMCADKGSSCSGIFEMIAKYNEKKGPFYASQCL